MARLLRSVTDVDVGRVQAYWRKFLEGNLPALHERTMICARVCRQLWTAHDAWISTVQPTIAHEAQPVLLKINNEHQALGVRLAKAELVLATSDDVSATWMGATLPLGILPGSIVVGLTSIGNQLRWLTATPDVVIVLDDGTKIDLGTFATAPGALSWWDTAAQQAAKDLEPMVEATKNAVDGALELAGDALRVVKGVVKGAAELVEGAGGLVTVGLGLGALYLLKK